MGMLSSCGCGSSAPVLSMMLKVGPARSRQCGNEFNEQAGRKCLRVGIEFDLGPDSHPVMSRVPG
jgi:hypothetical protein